jgi:hypothetical protein
MTHRRRAVRGLALACAMLPVRSDARTRLEEERA